MPLCEDLALGLWQQGAANTPGILQSGERIKICPLCRVLLLQTTRFPWKQCCVKIALGNEPRVLLNGRDLALPVRGLGFHPQHHKTQQSGQEWDQDGLRWGRWQTGHILCGHAEMPRRMFTEICHHEYRPGGGRRSNGFSFCFIYFLMACFLKNILLENNKKN